MEKRTKQNLEEALKEKVNPLLEETMEKSWGIVIPKIQSDITDNLKNPSLNVYIPQNLTFNAAKKHFKNEFIKKELRLHRGNISHLAKLLGVNRRSIHRTIKEFSIPVRELTPKSEEELQQAYVGTTIKNTLEHYKEIIQPQKMEKMYQELPNLTKSIARYLPLEELTWKEAEREFERQFLVQALRERQGNVPKTAQELKIRPETLYRKIKKLEIKV